MAGTLCGGNNTSGEIDVATTCNSHGGSHGRCDFESETFVCDPNQITSKENRSQPTPQLCHTLPGKENSPIAFSCKNHAQDASDKSPCLRAMNEVDGNANAGGQVAVAFEARFARNDRGAPTDIVPPLKAQSGQTGKGDASPLTIQSRQVRRLTPRECERLQGFPDDYTQIPYRGKPAKDGPRYRAIGNSMARPVMAWIGRRIDLFEKMND